MVGYRNIVIFSIFLVHIAGSGMEDSKNKHHKSVKPIRCGTCGVSVKNRFRLWEHLTSSHSRVFEKSEGEPKEEGVTLFEGKEGSPEREPTKKRVAIEVPCAHCGKIFSDRSECFAHVSLEHPERLPSVLPSEDQDKEIKKRRCKEDEQKSNVCDFCEVEFSSEEHLLSHFKENHTENFLECSICQKHFGGTVRLRQHLNAEHGTELDVSCIYKYKCDTCDFGCVRVATLERHLAKDHNQEKKFFCDICGASYFLEDSLQNHRYSQHKLSSKFSCSLCARQFAKLATYERHLSEEHCYELEKKFLCAKCGAAFFLEPSLAEHVYRSTCHASPAQQIQQEQNALDTPGLPFDSDPFADLYQNQPSPDKNTEHESSCFDIYQKAISNSDIFTLCPLDDNGLLPEEYFLIEHRD